MAWAVVEWVRAGTGGEAASVDEERDPEAIWGEVLSRDPARIRAAVRALAGGERAAVVAHLWRMTSEEGWMEGQRSSARAALDVLRQDGTA
jgi:hypothetical protein